MKIELAALSFSMSLLLICDRQLQNTHPNLCSHTVNIFCKIKEFCNICRIKFCKHERCRLKLIKEISQHFLQCIMCSHCAHNWHLSFKNAKTFCRRQFLSFDFSTNALVNRIKSFYFCPIKRIMQCADIRLTGLFS